MGLLIAASAFVLAAKADAATITVNAPDGYGRTFIDIIGDLKAGDEETFVEKAAVLSDPEKIVVTLASDGGDFSVAFRAGNLIRLTGMTTYVPAGKNCTSACAFMWLAGRPRTLGDGAHVGFHGVFSSRTGQQQVVANALLGTYLGYLGFSYEAVIWMVSPQPGAMHWLTEESVERYGIDYVSLAPPRVPPLPDTLQSQQRQRSSQPQEPPRQRTINVRVVENLDLHIVPDPYSEKVTMGPPLDGVIPKNATLELHYADLATDCRRHDDASGTVHTIWCPVLYDGHAGWVNAFYLDTGAIIWDGRLACSIDQTSFGCGQVTAQPQQDASTTPSSSGGADMVTVSIFRTAAPLTVAEECSLKPKDVFKECATCPEMVVVPAGSFTMGSLMATEAESYFYEGPQHMVTIARRFAVGPFAVTFDEWDACVADGGCNGYKPSDQGWGRGRRPVINVHGTTPKPTSLGWRRKPTSSIGY